MTEIEIISADIREAISSDADAIRRVNMAAFGRTLEANLVDVLRKHWQVMLSVTAEVDGQVVGHALFTHVTVMPTVPGLRMLGVGPVAVLPEYQGRGVGSMLTRKALELLRVERWQAVVALGAPNFFARFGFVPASQASLRHESRLPDDSFRLLELQPGALEGVQGVVRYQPEFSGF